MTLEKIIVKSDGGCRTNPGPAAWGFVIDFVGTGRKLTQAGFIPHASNNYAELAAIAEAAGFLLRVNELGPEVQFLSDSMLVVQTLNGAWNLKEPSLRDVFNLACARLAKLRLRVPKLSISWIKRADNSEADALCNLVQDEHGVVGLSWQARQKAKEQHESILRMGQAADDAGVYGTVILPED
jgi:ribonuclease HI